MSPAPQPVGPTGIHRRVGPFSVGGWFGILGGLVVVYLGYRWYENRESSESTEAEEAALASAIPAGQSNASTATSTSSAPSTLSAWIADAMSIAVGNGQSSTSAYNDIMSWLSGSTVSSAGYSNIGDAIEELGLPPGYSTAPVLSITSTSTDSSGTSTSGSTTTGTTTTPLVGVFSGSGYEPTAAQIGGALISAIDGSSWYYVSTPQELQTLLASGTTVGVQTAQGVFTPITAQQIAANAVPNTAIYAKAS